MNSLWKKILALILVVAMAGCQSAAKGIQTLDSSEDTTITLSNQDPGLSNTCMNFGFGGGIEGRDWVWLGPLLIVGSPIILTGLILYLPFSLVD